MSGVYQIYNTVNGKRYIGSSIHIEQRFKEHLRNLRANKYVNAHLQCAWNKYGEQSFILEEVELCEPDQCLKIEQEYIDYYHAADRNFGYNIDPYAEHSGNTLSEETRKKISEKAKGRKWSKERHEKWSDAYGITNPNYIKLANPIVYDDFGKIIPLSQRFDFTNPDVRYNYGKTAYEKEK